MKTRIWVSLFFGRCWEDYESAASYLPHCREFAPIYEATIATDLAARPTHANSLAMDGGLPGATAGATCSEQNL